MNIGIDARLLSTPIRGIASYLANLIKFLPEYDLVNKYYVFQYEDIPQENNFYTYISIKKNRIPRQLFEHYWINFTLPKLIHMYNIDIFFTPYIFVPLVKRDWKNVIVVADSLTKVCKEYYTFHYRKYLDYFVPPSIRRSDAVITISKSALNDIIKYYHINAEKIQVLYLWGDDKYKPLSISENLQNDILKKFNLPEKFVLFVSVLEERKNIQAIIRVSDILELRGVDLKFVLVGREGFGFNKIISELEKRKNRIIHLKNINDTELVLLYNLSTIFFFPTHYEGFGLPPLEAMKCGIPVVTSNNSSLPEVVGEGGIMGEATDYEFFANSIEKLLEDKKYYSSMKSKAIEQAKKFTPENHLNRLISTFNSLQQENKNL
ncbi:MAG: glycosyltransferase family 4 protein [Ignavibacteriales bacterium]|nr:glycosyltransferase family 4 protein [Ignavibacteriales bacterium]